MEFFPSRCLRRTPSRRIFRSLITSCARGPAASPWRLTFLSMNRITSGLEKLVMPRCPWPTHSENWSSSSSSDNSRIVRQTAGGRAPRSHPASRPPILHARLIHLFGEPFPSVQVDRQSEGEPGLQASAHETEHPVDPVMVDKQALPHAPPQLEFLGFPIARNPPTEAGLD